VRPSRSGGQCLHVQRFRPHFAGVRLGRVARRGRFVAFALLAAGTLASVAVAVTPPKGDTKAIQFFSSQFQAYQDVPGVRIVESGYFSVKRLNGSNVSYRWSQPTPRGYTPATAEILAWLDGTRITAYLATLSAPKIRHVRILMSGGSVFVASARCWHKSNANASPFGTGELYLLNDGGAVFQPLVKTDTTSVVTFSYDWSAGSKATEVTTFTNHTPPAMTTQITVTGKQAMTIRKTITPLASPPALPVSPPPALPRPTPRCR